MTVGDDYHLAYVFERFPTFTQTFCVREVTELQRLGLRPLIFSIRDTRGENLEDHFPSELIDSVHFLPPRDELIETVKKWKDNNELPQEAVLTLRHWGDVSDKARVYEGIYVGVKMREAGVVHAHSHFAGVGARCCFWARRFFGGAFSFTGHANDLFEPTDFEAGLEDLMREASLVVTVSDYTAGWLKEQFPTRTGKVVRVYNGLDLIPFETAAAEVGDAKERGLIVTVGRLIEKKGFDDLIRSCSELKARGIENFRVVIVGDGPMEDELRELIGELSCNDVVELAGAKTQSEIVELLARAQIFALPCVTEKGGGKDNLPTVIMEAMAARLPCVSTRLAGVPEMVEEGVTGLLTEEREPVRFAEAMEKLLGDTELCKRMGGAGQERARRLFAKEVTAAELRDALVSRGRVKFDPKLAKAEPKLWAAFARALVRKTFGVIKRSPPSRFAQAERAARKGSP